MTIKPLGEYVLVKMVEAEEKSVGGIILSNGSKEKPTIAEVLAVGDGKTPDGRSVDMIVKPGDKTIINKFVGLEVKLEGETYMILPQAGIIAMVEE